MKISVITACRNAASTISDTLHSVAWQSHQDKEHIVIDGASTDGTVTILRSHKAKFISEADSGVYQAMNKGIHHAEGEFVGFLNADDTFFDRDSLSVIAEHADGVDLVYGNLVIVDRTDPLKVVRYYDASRFKRWQMRFGYMPPHPTVYVRRSVLMDARGFNERYKIGGDFDLLLRLLWQRRCRARFIDRTLVSFKNGGMSTRGFSSTFAINREFRQACRDSHVVTAIPLLYLRYFTKFLQFFLRPEKA